MATRVNNGKLGEMPLKEKPIRKEHQRALEELSWKLDTDTADSLDCLRQQLDCVAKSPVEPSRLISLLEERDPKVNHRRKPSPMMKRSTSGANACYREPAGKYDVYRITQ